MHVQSATVAPTRPLTAPPRTVLKWAVSARLAHKVTHTGKPRTRPPAPAGYAYQNATPTLPGWSIATHKLACDFLEIIELDHPHVVESWRALLSVAEAALRLQGGVYATEAGVLKLRPFDPTKAVSAEQHREYSGKLAKWAKDHHLQTAWLLAAAHQALYATVNMRLPLTWPRTFNIYYSEPVIEALTFETEQRSFAGTPAIVGGSAESLTNWKKRQITAFSKALDAHVNAAYLKMQRDPMVERIPRVKRTTLAEAARWQVTGAHNGDRDAIRAVLKLLKLKPRKPL